MSYDKKYYVQQLSHLTEEQQTAMAMKLSLVKKPEFIKNGETFPDGTEVPPGHVFMKTWQVTFFPPGAHLRLVGSKNGFGVGDAAFSRDRGRFEIALGLTAPQELGKSRIDVAIFSSSGEKLLSLWCEVEVVNSISDEKAGPADSFAEALSPRLFTEGKPVSSTSLDEKAGPSSQDGSVGSSAKVNTDKVAHLIKTIEDHVYNNRCLVEENGSLHKKLERLREENERLCEENKRLNADNARLNADNALLHNENDDIKDRLNAIETILYVK